MGDNRVLIPAHQHGEVERGGREQDLLDRGKAVATFGGEVLVRWDADAAVTALAPVTYFLEVLKTNGLWQQCEASCVNATTSSSEADAGRLEKYAFRSPRCWPSSRRRSNCRRAPSWTGRG
jgi:hypothetical protein